ncbi:hypothetical protein S83_040741 [Arachis hypogaea]
MLIFVAICRSIIAFGVFEGADIDACGVWEEDKRGLNLQEIVRATCPTAASLVDYGTLKKCIKRHTGNQCGHHTSHQDTISL